MGDGCRGTLQRDTHCFTPGCPGPLEAAQSWGQQPCTASSLMATGAHTGASIDCLPGHPKQCLTHRAANPAPGFSVFCWDTCTMLCRALSTPSEPPITTTHSSCSSRQAGRRPSSQQDVAAGAGHHHQRLPSLGPEDSEAIASWELSMAASRIAQHCHSWSARTAQGYGC